LYIFAIFFQIYWLCSPGTISLGSPAFIIAPDRWCMCVNACTHEWVLNNGLQTDGVTKWPTDWLTNWLTAECYLITLKQNSIEFPLHLIVGVCVCVCGDLDTNTSMHCHAQHLPHTHTLSHTQDANTFRYTK